VIVTKTIYVSEAGYLSNGQLLLGNIAGHVNELHAVLERLGNHVHHVGRADEQHLQQSNTLTIPGACTNQDTTPLRLTFFFDSMDFFKAMNILNI